jgi:hypothetical protein
MVPLAFFIIFNRPNHTGISIILQRRDEAKPFTFALLRCSPLEHYIFSCKHRHFDHNLIKRKSE